MSSVLHSDSPLLARARCGDRDAFGQLVSRHQTLVASIAYGICGDFARSEDIAQETFVTAWRQLSSLADDAKFKAWLCGIARNLAHNATRREARRPELPPMPDTVTPEAASETPNPREHAVTHEESALVWSALEKLPEIYREPLILFYREQQSIARVAGALDLTEDAVKQRLARGRAMLRAQVEELVQRSLGSTAPGAMFTTAVLGALPGVVPSIVTSSAGAAKSGTLATTAAPLAKFLPVFLGHLAVAFGGYFWRRNRKTPSRISPKGLFIAAAILWGLIAATVGLFWLLTR